MTPGRRRLVLGTLPVGVIAVAVAIKLIGMVALSSLSSAAYARGDFESATDLARWQTIVNVIEPWKAHFAVGDGLAARQLDAEASNEFDRALELAAPAEQCPIRVNLVMVLERQGDTALAVDAADIDGARAFYDRALAVIAEADDVCLSPPQDGRDATDEPLKSSKERLDDKSDALDAADTPDPETGQDDPADDAPADDTVKQLEEKLGQSGKDRSDLQTADRAPVQPGSVDKPW